MGTAPTAQSPTGTPDERYERMGEVFGETARSALSCGMHVHVGVDSRADGVRALTAIRPWLPVVLALSANSPYWDGRDTGYQSWRAMLWQQWPTAGPVSAFADVADYERTCAAVVESGAAVDDGMLYFDARLSASYPTLEIRVADVCARVEDAVAIAGLCRAIVVGALDGALPSVDAVAGRVEVLRAAVWRAARYGIGGALLNPSTMRLAPAGQVIGELLSALRTVLPEADAAALTGALAGIARRGTGSALQRRAFERERRTADLVDALAEATLS